MWGVETTPPFWHLDRPALSADPLRLSATDDGVKEPDHRITSCTPRAAKHGIFP